MKEMINALVLMIWSFMFLIIIATIIVAAIVIPKLIKKHRGKISGFVKTAFADTKRKTEPPVIVIDNDETKK